MSTAPDLTTLDLTDLERALAAEDPDAAHAALLDALAHRAETGDRLATLALETLSRTRFAPDVMAATVDRLLALVREQEAQIRTLQALLDPDL